MTIETNTTLQLSDISAIEFECDSCHTKTVLPIAKFTNAPIHCPFCEKSPQWFIPGSRDFADVNVLGRVIQWFSNAEKPKGFVMRLHITNPSASVRVGA